jgi:N-acetylmuramoyl-L-alanine amidase
VLRCTPHQPSGLPLLSLTQPSSSPLLLILHTYTLHAQTDNYLKAIARPGEGVTSLLQQYSLDEYPCNYDQFYKINKIKQGSWLAVNKIYLVPILIYEYNGKSIRSTIGNYDIQKAKRIQTFNADMLKDGLQMSTYETSKILWVPWHEQANCAKGEHPEEKEKPTPTLTASKPAVLDLPAPYAIFGTEYAKIPQYSQKLKGRVYYIDAGHGGPDCGAIGKRDGHFLYEDEYAYDVSLRLARMLIANGATTYLITRDKDDGIRDQQYLTSDTDEYCWPSDNMPSGQKERLSQRAEAINKLYEANKKKGVTIQRSISIHIDSRSKSERVDMFFYHQNGVTMSEKVAKKLHTAVKTKYDKLRGEGYYEGDVSTRDLFMLREVKPVAVFIELANIQNQYDQQRIILPKNRQLIAEWLCEGFLNE